MKPHYLIALLVMGFMITHGTATTGTETDGYLSIISSPSGATVYVDDSQAGVTPVIVTIGETSSPPHIITLQESGYLDWTTTIDQNPAPGTAETISATLQKNSETGSISVTSTPTGATVSCDGTNIQETPYTYQQIPAGSHTITISKEGYSSYSTPITVASGAESVVSAALSTDSSSHTGSISVSSTPSGATVTLDDSLTKRTPCTYQDIPAGTHALSITRDGYSLYATTVTVSSGEESSVTAILNRITSTGSLTVNSNPSGATIYLNGVYYGVTPAHLTDIESGIYTIKAEKSQYTTGTEIINLIAGKENSVLLSLTPNRPDWFFDHQIDMPYGIPFGGDIPMNIGPGGPPGRR
ncbi:MAG: PEGA domain-containing protein [Methanospirillum sp.]|uniref:PEGA domain-containing protein n=1 Tax=Methanospirillum sp. TaxID=45200 RepID=UPI002374C33A|nr:PEGA domain-containing protein [Methanospirillum sp.]MDD1730364.1 PEGA domain-containing protein [Methanospirillum sp.]